LRSREKDNQMDISAWLVKEWITGIGKSNHLVEIMIMGQVYDNEMEVSGD
jgi:hypothetical protein